MLLSNLVVAGSFLILAITAVPHIRERHIIRVPIKFKTIHHHKIQKIPIIIRKHVHYNKEPEVQHIHFNHLSHDDHFDFDGDHQVPKETGISYDHEDGHDTHEDEYEDEQSEEEEYEDDEYE